MELWGAKKKNKERKGYMSLESLSINNYIFQHVEKRKQANCWQQCLISASG